VTDGSAVTGFDEPICGVLGTTTTCAWTAMAAADNTTAPINRRRRRAIPESDADENMMVLLP
jgi:hypothetical protein